MGVQNVQHVYDARGRVDYTLNARNQKLDYDYEPWGPLKEVRYYPAAGASTPDRTVSYSRDFNGNVTGMTDDAVQPGSLYTFTHDALSRLTRIEQQGVSPAAITLMSYDAVGNLLTVTDPESHTTSYTYDRLSRNTQVTQPLESMGSDSIDLTIG